MADHFYSINRGESGFKPADIAEATSSTSADDIELRVADAAGCTREDVLLALDAFKRRFQSGVSLVIGGTDFPKL